MRHIHHSFQSNIKSHEEKNYTSFKIPRKLTGERGKTSVRSFLQRFTGCRDRARNDGQKQQRLPHAGSTRLDITPIFSLRTKTANLYQEMEQISKWKFLSDKGSSIQLSDFPKTSKNLRAPISYTALELELDEMIHKQMRKKSSTHNKIADPYQIKPSFPNNRDQPATQTSIPQSEIQRKNPKKLKERTKKTQLLRWILPKIQFFRELRSRNQSNRDQNERLNKNHLDSQPPGTGQRLEIPPKQRFSYVSSSMWRYYLQHLHEFVCLQ